MVIIPSKPVILVDNFVGVLELVVFTVNVLLETMTGTVQHTVDEGTVLELVVVELPVVLVDDAVVTVEWRVVGTDNTLEMMVAAVSELLESKFFELPSPSLFTASFCIIQLSGSASLV